MKPYQRSRILKTNSIGKHIYIQAMCTVTGNDALLRYLKMLYLSQLVRLTVIVIQYCKSRKNLLFLLFSYFLILC